MVNKALLVRLEAKPGKESDVEQFLRSGLAIVPGEPATTDWFARAIETRAVAVKPGDLAPGPQRKPGISDEMIHGSLDAWTERGVYRRRPIVMNNPPSRPSDQIHPTCASNASGSQLSGARANKSSGSSSSTVLG
jgi:hypothetical protein